ncbi:MAG: glycosyltransferase, partial [Ilumatobacteraceae bacterium]
MKFTLDTTTRFTPGRIIGGSPPSILRLSRRGEETVTRIISGADIEITPLVRRMLNLNQIHPAFDHDCPRAEAVVTVITPAFGQRTHQHPEGDGIKVVVVDDGSQPPLHDATIRLEVNGGPGSARNEALQFVDTEFVAFVDADIDVGSDSTWIRSLLHHFDDPEVAAVAPRVRSIARDGVVARHELRRGAL